MHYHRRKGWELKESAVTPEELVFSRRSALMFGAGLAATSAIRPALAATQAETDALYPFRRNEAYKIERPVTAESVNSNFNNFYEFGTSKSTAAAAQQLKTRPWLLKLDGMVEKEREIGIDDLITAMPREERLYSLRCVEGWSMTIAWGGFPLKALVEMAKPLASAKYLRFETFLDPRMAPGQNAPFYPWPYSEGVTIAEAANDLAFMVTGAYGKPLAKQFGAPLRLALPWKYGFKSIKSIARITFTDRRPVSLWEQLQPAEYGFWANVNPEVAHPRWSQATETVLGTNERVPTRLFNGYGEYVSGLYSTVQGEKLWM